MKKNTFPEPAFLHSLLNLLRLFLINLGNPKLAIIHSPQSINIVYTAVNISSPTFLLLGVLFKTIVSNW